jgi:hypothetical protein
LEYYHQSARKVEEMSQKLKKTSVYMGASATALFGLAFVSYYNSRYEKATIVSNPRLRASPDDLLNSSSDNIDFTALSSTFSMFIWGLVMAKAKTGFNASGSKDKESVGQAFKKLLGMVALISVATLAKLNAENNYIENWVNSSGQDPH